MFFDGQQTDLMTYSFSTKGQVGFLLLCVKFRGEGKSHGPQWLTQDGDTYILM